MRSFGLLTAALFLAMTGVAAGLAYQSGAYNVDPCAVTTSKPCSKDSRGKLRMTVGKGHFTVRRVSLTETCDNGIRSFQEGFTFITGLYTKLAGGVARNGHLHGTYEDRSNLVKVNGTVQGRRLTLDVTEKGSFTKEGEPTFNCAGSLTFHARGS